jgi:hypothetical protein
MSSSDTNTIHDAPNAPIPRGEARHGSVPRGTVSWQELPSEDTPERLWIDLGGEEGSA